MTSVTVFACDFNQFWKHEMFTNRTIICMRGEYMNGIKFKLLESSITNMPENLIGRLDQHMPWGLNVDKCLKLILYYVI